MQQVPLEELSQNDVFFCFVPHKYFLDACVLVANTACEISHWPSRDIVDAPVAKTAVI